MVRKKKKTTKKSIFTKQQLNLLYECWKEGNNTQERLALIEERMPRIPTLAALKVMRRMSKSDPKWLKWTTRQKNLKEKEKLEKQKEREQKIKEREQRRKEREHRKIEREKKQRKRNQKKFLEKFLDPDMSKRVENNIETEFFFCPDVHQYVNNISCIFRVFSNDFSFGNICDKCTRMDKYIPTLKEIVNVKPKDTKRQRSTKHKTSQGRSKDKVKTTEATKTNTRKKKRSSTKCTTTTRSRNRKS